jgi:hypothetical protein
MQGQEHRAIAQGGGGQVGLEGRQAEEADLHPALADGGVLLQRPGQQRHQGRAGRQGGGEPAAGQQAEPLAEQPLGGLVHGDQGALRVDDQGGFR